MLNKLEQTQYQGIQVTIKRSRRKSCAFKVNNGTIEVFAPTWYPTFEIMRALDAKQDYIFKHLANPLKKASFQWENGETVYVLGEPYTLVKADAKKGSVSIEGNKIIIAAPSENAAMNAYKKFATGILDELLDIFRAELKEDVGDYGLSYRFYTGRWGCCATKKREVVINLWCVGLPEEGIRYVFYHELAHLQVANHSKAFYQRLQQLWPDYKRGLKITKTYTIK